ncbi:MAG: translation initiation factor IF-3 [bacterium]|nr:translation initiation factor IF-3 [bacterium]
MHYFSCIRFLLEVKIIAKEKDNPINEQIRFAEVMVIGPNGEKLGIKSKADALVLANYAGFDLVLINDKADVPVCKIMDYNKFRYEKQKKIKEAKKKQREANIEIKEYRLSVNIDKHDFDTRVKNAIKNLEKGCKIKASIRFKGRQFAHPELGKEVLMRFADVISNVADIESMPKLEGRSMFMQFTPKK